MAKWTRKEVVKVAYAMKQAGYSEAGDMLLDLAPPDEPRQWQVGDLLRWGGRSWRVCSVAGTSVAITAICGTCWRTVGTEELADAIPLKLVPMEDGR